MDEHDDDLESTVHEGMTAETDGFPATADDLNDLLRQIALVAEKSGIFFSDQPIAWTRSPEPPGHDGLYGEVRYGDR